MSSQAAPNPSTGDMATNLANLLPTGTFLTFSTLAPLFTNNGMCGMTEKIMTGMLLGTFVGLVFVLNFIDSVTTESGKVYYGIVTTKGLYNPQFARSNIPGDLRRDDSYFTGTDDTMYKVNVSDVVNGILDVVAFGTLSLLAAPITTCYYPDLPGTVIKTAPILVALIVGVFFAFAPPGRHGVGFAVTTAGFQLVPETDPEVVPRQASSRILDPSNRDRLLVQPGPGPASSSPSPSRSPDHVLPRINRESTSPPRASIGRRSP
ncbi:hypothetical protein MPTK1_6g03820 [Marchantia polymorpha subsp. ruderalis]|uniref:Uncharacterized protein n=2 Tax=Marchantia polymorpha TaxID=3197 RepID=A0AAF6BN93_MARPO|nr:hypothetical protein MARPO_0034s0136 [Marchantia polymorpha]BBN13477.1 hypothetical protein Mp_6g03820 [Marchantia polymorpha subsp. ruderalis]|eukprot:PTQ41563.1 hypothetical protein MARPO_0034s0136 [Marchantia polymorpha]